MEYSAERFEKSIDTDSFKRKYVDCERFIKACRECPNFGKFWSCPPYSFDVMDVWNKYETLTVIAYRIRYSGERTFPEMLSVMDSVREEIGKEAAAAEKDLPGSLALYAGHCSLCRECARVQGKPCRNPDKMRYSIESLGGDVVGILEDLLGLKTEWMEGGRLPEHLILAAGLLKPHMPETMAVEPQH